METPYAPTPGNPILPDSIEAFLHVILEPRHPSGRRFTDAEIREILRAEGALGRGDD